MPLSRSTTPTPLVLVQPTVLPAINTTQLRPSTGDGPSSATLSSSAARPLSPSGRVTAATTPTREPGSYSYTYTYAGTPSKSPRTSPTNAKHLPLPLPELRGSASNEGLRAQRRRQEYPSDEAELEALSNRLLIETKIKDGAENLLQVFRAGGEQRDGLRGQVEAELHAANSEIESLEGRIAELQVAINGKLAQDAQADELSYSDEDSRTAVASALDALRSLTDDDKTSQSTSAGTSFARQDQKIEILNGLVQSIQRNERVKWEIPCQVVVDHLLPNLADRESQNLRAATYRTLRYLCKDPRDVHELITNGLELFLLRSLARNPSFELEKTEALLLVRSWFSSTSRPSSLSIGTIRAIVALSENSDEKLRFIALETLTELVLFDVALLVKAEGLRVVLQAFIEGPYELSPALAAAFLPIMDLPETRKMLRPGLDIEIVISSFTTASGKAPSSGQDEKLRTCASIVGLYLKSFTGLIYLSMNHKQAIKSFISAINSPHAHVREAILNTLFDIFRIENAEVSSKKRSTIRKSGDTIKLRARSDSASRSNNMSTEEPYNRLNLVEHYLGFLLVILVDAGLFESLIAAKDRSASFAKKAAILVGELLALSTRVLPFKYGIQWQTLPRLFALVSHFDNMTDRLLATSVLSNIDRYTRLQGRPQAHSIAMQNSRNRSNSLDDPLLRGQRQLETSKIRQGMQIDDMAWKNLLLESQVLVGKDHQKWNYDSLLEAMEGPLLNPARLNEAIKATKFLRRVIAFFHPFEKRYSDLANTPDNLKWTKLGCAMLTTLISNPDGIAFLQQDRLLPQLAEALGQLDPNHSNRLIEPIFTERRFAATLASGYFAMLGTLSKSPEGLRMMEKAKIFTLFYHLTDLKGREDIVTAAIESLHYESDGHARVVLSKALNSSYKHVRLFATKHLGRLLREMAGPKDWIIRLLVTQLYDTSSEVRDLSVSMLNEVCQSPDILETVIELRPCLDHLGGAGAPLLFRFLSSPFGIRYLHEIGFIEQEMEHWFHELNDVYVVQLEVVLAKTMNIGPKDLEKPSATFDGTVPLHFYGELVKTSEGRMILEAKGHFREFADFIRTHGLEHSDSEVMDKLKSVLWAVGHVGATSGGIMFLENEGIIVDIAHIATNSMALSIRGTCFFVLGLISCSLEGAELLEASGWTAAYTPIGLPTGYCLPEDVDSFIALDPWTSQRLSTPPQSDMGIPNSNIEREIVTALANLSNNLLTHTASKLLARVKQRHPDLFKSRIVFARAIHLLKTCHYRAAVRTYILDLFNVPLTVEVVKEVSEAGRAARIARRTASQVEERKSVLLLNTMYKLNVDTDSEDDEPLTDDEIIPKEMLEPVMVLRGFGI